MERANRQIKIKLKFYNDYDFVEQFKETDIWLNKHFAKEIEFELKNKKMIGSKGKVSFKFKTFEHGSIIAIFIAVVVDIAVGVISNRIYDYIREKLDERNRRRGPK